MGEPAVPTREERDERVALARGIVEAVRNDEEWPDPLRDLGGDGIEFFHVFVGDGEACVACGESRSDVIHDEERNSAREVTIAVFGLAQECAMLADRNAELLAAIRRITAETPTEDEAGIAAVLIAEVGTLRARLAELEQNFAVEHQLAMWARQAYGMDQSGYGLREDEMAALRELVRDIDATMTTGGGKVGG